MGKRVLILGASGFIGNALYKELLPYFDVYGTFFSANDFYEQNEVFFKFDANKDDVDTLLNLIKPNVIISCFKANLASSLKVHQQLMGYTMVSLNCRLLYVSTAQVFDGAMDFPATEKDKPLAISTIGKHSLSIEKILAQLPQEKQVIVRLPLVLGINAPRIIQLKESLKNRTLFEVYPNLVVNVTTDLKLSQQIHYIINQKKQGIFHLGTTDLIHYSDLFEEITEKLGLASPVFKHIFRSNKDRFLAILPKSTVEVDEHQYTVNDIIDQITLKEGIQTLKTLFT